MIRALVPHNQFTVRNSVPTMELVLRTVVLSSAVS